MNVNENSGGLQQQNTTSSQVYDKKAKNLQQTANAILTKTNPHIASNNQINPKYNEPVNKMSSPNNNISEAERQLISASGQFGYATSNNNGGDQNNYGTNAANSSPDKRSKSRASNKGGYNNEYGSNQQSIQQQATSSQSPQKDYMMSGGTNNSNYGLSATLNNNQSNQQQFTSLMQMGSSQNNNQISKHGAAIILGMNAQNSRISSNVANNSTSLANSTNIQPIQSSSLMTSQSPQITTKKIFMNNHQLSGQQSHKLLTPMNFSDNKSGLPLVGSGNSAAVKPKIEKVNVNKDNTFDSIKPISIHKDQINFAASMPANKQSNGVQGGNNNASNSDLFNVQNSPLSTSPSPNATSPLTQGIQNLGLTMTKEGASNQAHQAAAKQQDAQLKNRTAAISKEMDNFLSNF